MLIFYAKNSSSCAVLLIKVGMSFNVILLKESTYLGKLKITLSVIFFLFRLFLQIYSDQNHQCL